MRKPAASGSSAQGRAISALRRQSLSARHAFAFLLVIIIGLLDYVTGSDVALSVLYLFPVVLAVVLTGRRGGMIVSIFCSMVWFAADIMSPASRIRPAVLAWNAVGNMGIFSLVAFTVDEFRQEQKKREELMLFIVHDLRTPLFTAMASLQALDFSSGLNKAQAGACARALSSCRWMSSLIEAILEHSRIESGRSHFSFRPVPPCELLEGAIEKVAAWAEQKSIMIERNLQVDGRALLNVDPAMSARVLVNLLSNAIKFTPAGKSIAIGVSPCDAGELVFCVADQGPGIARERIQGIFEMFSQYETSTPENNGGTGLGLAFCRMVVEAQRGKIWLESEPGRGTRVYFTLPLAVQAA